MSELDWLDMADWACTKALIAWPASKPVIDGIQKHVQYALRHPKEVELEQVVQDTRGRMTAAMVNYQGFEDYFAPVLEKASG